MSTEMKKTCIIIDGHIGVGKSTLINSLKEEFVDFKVKLEPVEKWTLMKEMYETKDFSIENYLNVSKQVFQTLIDRDLNCNVEDVIIERSFLSSEVFIDAFTEYCECENHSGFSNLKVENQEKYQQLKQIYNVIIIWLYTTVDKSKQRMLERDGHCVPYIANLDKAYKKIFSMQDNIFKVDVIDKSKHEVLNLVKDIIKIKTL